MCHAMAEVFILPLQHVVLPGLRQAGREGARRVAGSLALTDHLLALRRVKRGEM